MNNEYVNIEQILNKYLEVCEKQLTELQQQYPEVLKIDRKNISWRILNNLYQISTLCRGQNISKCFFDEKQCFSQFYSKTSSDVMQFINQDETFITFGLNSCEITTKDKKIKMGLNNLFNPTPEYPIHDYSSLITVEKITPNGIYKINLADPVSTLYSHNDDLMTLAQKIGCTIEECKFNYLHNHDAISKNISLTETDKKQHLAILHYFNVKKNNLPVLGNILFNKDFSSICVDAFKTESSLRNGDYPFIDANKFINLTSEEIKPFLFTNEELDKINNMHESFQSKMSNVFEESSIKL